MMKETAQAHANIALVKYWGKRDEQLILPTNSSLSMTCDGLLTKTTIAFSKQYTQDTLTINGKIASQGDKNVFGHLERMRHLAGVRLNAKIVSESNFPVAAGLASSSSGLAALTLAAMQALGLKKSEKELTILARQGSGSASRSMCEGFAVWHRGTKKDGTDSFAETIATKNNWKEFRMIATVVSEEKKHIGSRSGMAQSMKTSPYFATWVNAAEEDCTRMQEEIAKKDFEAVGMRAEQNALKMHAVMISTNPPIIYWIPKTIAVMEAVQELRAEGIPAYFTIDGGPQVKIICLEKNVSTISKKIKSVEGVLKTIVCKPGDGASVVADHLF
ncbi:MAG: diphosphomevalonate decarboxylase [Candidatus Aenigmarchaeota archaeon]|nr:diphosphomevalonate decarboxylase [Candidatus Aenigmarchaeota archaeon]